MIAYHFQADGSGASGKASVGREQIVQPALSADRCPPYRAQLASSGEQQLISHFVTALADRFPRNLLINYYVSLKTNPFVVLTGREGAGKAALAAGFAAALIGQDNGQFITIGSDGWARRYSQSDYYRDIHERFAVSQYLEALHEAAAPENLGRVYLVLLKGLTVEALDTYINRLVRLDEHGERHLALPGLPEQDQPVLPPNCFITATLHLPRVATPLDQQVLRHAGQIEFSPALHATATVPTLPLPPVGLQRVMLGAVCHDPRKARDRLSAILGRHWLHNLGPSPAVMRPLLAGGVPIPRELSAAVLPYVANSFDDEGRGLFNPSDPRRNAQLAYDAQIVQRLLWRIDWRRRALHQRLAAVLQRS